MHFFTQKIKIEAQIWKSHTFVVFKKNRGGVRQSGKVQDLTGFLVWKAFLLYLVFYLSTNNKNKINPEYSEKVYCTNMGGSGSGPVVCFLLVF